MKARRLADLPRVTLGLPELTGEEALILVEILDRCSTELRRRYGDEILDVLVDSLPAEPPDDDRDADPRNHAKTEETCP